MWAMAIVQHGPAFSKYRLEITKVISFIYVVDDIFDLVGSLEELSLFTDVVKRSIKATNVYSNKLNTLIKKVDNTLN